MQHQQNHQVQYALNHNSGSGQANFIDPSQQQQQQQQQHSNPQLLRQTTMSPNLLAPSPIIPINITQSTTQGHMSMNLHQPQQPQHYHHQQQKNQILPLLLSSQPPNLAPSTNVTPTPNPLATPNDQGEFDHEQIIDQVISLENDYSDGPVLLGNIVDDNACDMGMISGHQQLQQHQIGGINPSSSICLPETTSEDLLNLLLEIDGEDPNLMTSSPQMDLDERVGIENIRKQLMSCDMQSSYSPQPSTHQQATLHHQPSSQHPQQPQTQSQASHHNNLRITSPRQGQHPMQPHPVTTSPQLQKLHHSATFQQRNQSQSVSPPTTSEPSPVVKKNPLLNAQLVNSPSSISSTGFLSNTSNILNQTSILNPQPRFMEQQQTNFNYDSTAGVSGGCTTSVPIGPSSGLSQQVKQEIRRKVQQPKPQHQTSLLKQLLSEDSK